MYGGYPYSPYFNPQTGQLMAPGIGQNFQPMQIPGAQPNAMQGPQSPQQTGLQSGPDWLMVSDLKQVEQVSVPAGGKAWVMLNNSPVFALRTADNMGLITTDYYRFEKYDPEVAKAEPAAKYITPEQLEERLAAFADSLKPTRAKKGETAE